MKFSCEFDYYRENIGYYYHDTLISARQKYTTKTCTDFLIIFWQGFANYYAQNNIDKLLLKKNVLLTSMNPPIQ